MKPSCQLGYTDEDLQNMFDEQTLQRFFKWMRGQTVALCDGRYYDHDEQRYHDSGCGPHGPAYYQWDVERFTLGLPIVD